MPNFGCQVLFHFLALSANARGLLDVLDRIANTALLTVGCSAAHGEAAAADRGAGAAHASLIEEANMIADAN